MRHFDDLASLQAAQGEHLGYSAWHRVSQAAIDQFAAASGDHQWIHVDSERAAAGPFGGTIAHGWLTLAIGTTMIAEVVQVRHLRLAINYGTNRVRFPAPVPSGTRVRSGVELVSTVEETDGCRVVYRVVVEVEGSAKPACVAETVALYRWE